MSLWQALRSWFGSSAKRDLPTEPSNLRANTAPWQGRDLFAKDGAVVVGQTHEGTQITVNNWSVSESTIRHYAATLRLPTAQAEAVSRDF